MKDYESKIAIFPKLHRRSSSCIDSESLKSATTFRIFLERAARRYASEGKYSGEIDESTYY